MKLPINKKADGILLAYLLVAPAMAHTFASDQKAQVTKLTYLQAAAAPIPSTRPTTRPDYLYVLTVSGSYTLNGIQDTHPVPPIVISNTVLPDARDTRAFEADAKILGVSNIKGLTVQLVSKTPARVTFRIQFMGDYAGVSMVSYDLTYEYVK